jgi:hypothetical protein
MRVAVMTVSGGVTVIMGVAMAVDVSRRSRAIILVLVHFSAILRVCPGRRSPPASLSGQFDTSLS